MKLFERIFFFFNNNIEVTIAVLVMLLTVILLSEWIERNHYKLKIKEEVKEITEATIINFMVSDIGPIRYVMDIKYEYQGEIHKRSLSTYGKFASKYRDKDNIKIVVIPNSNMVFFYEESWKEINQYLMITICEIVFILVAAVTVVSCNCS